MHALPPITALRAFLVACHAGSFTAAAQELCITHGAVSRHIQGVEKWFGVNLFRKEGQRRVPTPYALTLARELGSAFDTLSDIALRYGNGGRNNVFNVSVPTTMSLKWLLPRLDDFYTQFPEANLQISTANTEQLHIVGHYDLLIRRETSATEYSAIPFLADTHCLMASPALLKRFPLETPEDVLKCPRIETSPVPDTGIYGWRRQGWRNRRSAAFAVTIIFTFRCMRCWKELASGWGRSVRCRRKSVAGI